MLEYRTLRFAGYQLIGFVGAVFIVLTPVWVLGPPEPHSAPTALRIATFTAAVASSMIWVAFFSVRAYRTLDEFQRQREKTAWYWGSVIGLWISIPLFSFIGGGGLHWIDPAIPSSAQLWRSFLIGYLLPVSCIMIGTLFARYYARHHDI